jgi:hypothetical protein
MVFCLGFLRRVQLQKSDSSHLGNQVCQTQGRIFLR